MVRCDAAASIEFPYLLLHDHTKVNRPPGPTGTPFLGSLLRAQRDPLQFTLDLCRQYGDVVRFRIGMYTGYLVNHPDHYRHVLISNQDNYDKHNYNYRKLRPVLGNGLITSDGAQWQRSRRMVQPAFHTERIRQLESKITETTGQLLNRWEHHVLKGDAVDAKQEMTRLTFRLMAGSLFSNDLMDVMGEVRDAFTVLNREITRRFTSAWVPPLWLYTPRNRAFVKARNTLDRIVRAIIDRRRRRGDPTGDILDILLHETDASGRRLSDRQVRNEVMTLMLAGHETTANLLTWTLGLLAVHPSVQEKVIPGEVGRQSATGQEPMGPDIKQVLQESLRMYPPVWIFSRRAIAKDRIGGYSIPAGATITMCTYALHRNPEFWDEPERFDPMRFMPSNGNRTTPAAYFPFGAGPRTCIGGHMAMTEARIVLQMICDRFAIQLEPGRKLIPEPLITLQPRGGLKLLLERRDFNQNIVRSLDT